MEQRILVVDNHDSFVYNLVQVLRESCTREIDVVRGEDIPFGRLGRYGGIVLSPGPGIPSEALGMMRLLDLAYSTHRILGVCLGHQAIAEYFGGQLVQLEHPLHGIRSRCHILETAGMWEGIASPTLVGRYHSWSVDRNGLPGCLRVSSEDEEERILSLTHKELPIWGVQFHPESYMTHDGVRLIQNWLKEL